jgi:hypothetical protein
LYICLYPIVVLLSYNYERICIAKNEENMPNNTDNTKSPFTQETAPATNTPTRVGMNISLEDVNNPLIINILKDV